MAGSLQSEDGLIKEDLLGKGDLLYHAAVVLPIDEFVVGITLEGHFLQFFTRNTHPCKISMYG